jgi:DNA-binding MarR family transcriptional regulator
MQLLWALAHMLDSASKRMRVTVGVTGPQRLALRIVGHYGRLSPGELARVLHVHPSSLTGVLRRLEGARFIIRERHPSDRRRAVLKLSASGKRLNARRAATVEAAVRRVLAAIPRSEIAGAKALLKALAAELEAQWAHHGSE